MNSTKSSNFSIRQSKTLLYSILLDLFGFTSILPLFPGILAFYEHNDQSHNFRALLSKITHFRSQVLNAPEILKTTNSNTAVISVDSILLGGFLGSWFSLLQCFSNPIFIKLAQNPKIGAKKILILSLSGSILSSMIWYQSTTFFKFFLARTLGGFFEGNVSLSISLLAQNKSETSRKRCMAYVGICYSLAFVFGPLIGVRLSNYLNGNLFSEQEFYKLPAVFSGVCSFAAALILVFRYENEPINEESGTENSNNDNQKINRLYMTYFIYLLAFSGIEFNLGFL